MALAAILSVESTGSFVNATDRGGNGVTGEGTSSIDWGNVASGNFNSGYQFGGETLSTDNEGTFLLGTLTHRNGVIWKSNETLVSSDLDIDISGTLAGQDFSVSETLSIDHIESLNSLSPCPYTNTSPCGDTVSFGLFDLFKFKVNLDGISYLLKISGLFDNVDGSGEAVTGFATEEMAYSSAYLVGSLTMLEMETPPTTPPTTPPVTPIPLPAAGLLLIGAIGTLLFGRRRVSVQDH